MAGSDRVPWDGAADVSGAWDGTRILRCQDGPWHGEERVWSGEDLEVEGRTDGLYVAWPSRDPNRLIWSIERRPGWNR